MTRRIDRSAAGAVATLVLAGLLLAAPAARADTATFSNTTAIPIGDRCATCAATAPGKGNPYPSNILVSGLAGTVTKVTATLHNFSHSFPGDVDVMLVGPAGQNLLLLSDAANGPAFSNVTVTFDDAAAGTIPLTGPAVSPSKPVDYDGAGDADAFPAPAPAPSSATTLATFNGSNPNGTWSLYVVDDTNEDTGTIAGGWSITITTNAGPASTTTSVSSSPNPSATGENVTLTATVSGPSGNVGANGTVTFREGSTPLSGAVPLDAGGTASFTTNALSVGSHSITADYSGTSSLSPSSGSVTQVVVNASTFSNTTAIPIGDRCATCAATAPGKGNPYPSNILVSGLAGTVVKVTATLHDFSHSFPGDVDVMLVGPAGQNLLLLSDAANGPAFSNVTVTFDDAAAGTIPLTGPAVSPSKPVDYDGAGDADAFPAPAPAPSSATTLATFNGSDPNGTWSLYVVDDTNEDTGTIAGGWSITITTTAPAGSPDLVVTKSGSPGPVVAGANITYTINVSNTIAAVPASNVTLPTPSRRTRRSSPGSCRQRGRAQPRRPDRPTRFRAPRRR